jgi:mannose-6-phosphate isomerase-like protein (cupin superfamily)
MDEVLLKHESTVEYRFNDVSGPKYLLRGPRCDVGLVVLQPGEDFPTHYHHHIEEDFFTLEGSAEFYIRDQHLVVKPGDLLHIPPLNPHYLINRGDVPWRALFVKAPFDEQDKGNLDWKPGDPPMPAVE